jgi:hypothetical protein|tara:strand:+ start:333 stop:491 length:159 start_codon:yes stop_codon:yes gene_type:complete
MEKKSLSSLKWVCRYLDETPGDEEIGGLGDPGKIREMFIGFQRLLYAKDQAA